MRSLLVSGLFAAALVAAGCGGSQESGGGGTDPRGGAPVTPAGDRAALEQRPVAKLFTDLGCAGCHGPAAEHHARLKQSVGRPADDVVRWILDPQAQKPGTEMPAYQGLIEEADARQLAEWVQQYARTIP